MGTKAHKEVNDYRRDRPLPEDFFDRILAGLLPPSVLNPNRATDRPKSFTTLIKWAVNVVSSLPMRTFCALVHLFWALSERCKSHSQASFQRSAGAREFMHALFRARDLFSFFLSRLIHTERITPSPGYDQDGCISLIMMFFISCLDHLTVVADRVEVNRVCEPEVFLTTCIRGNIFEALLGVLINKGDVIKGLPCEYIPSQGSDLCI